MVSKQIPIKKLVGRIISQSTSKGNMQALANMAADMITRRTRDGYGVSRPRGFLERLKPLAQSTVERRKRLKLHGSTTPETSNLTETGQMLRALVGRARNGRATLIIQGTKAQRKARINSEQRPFLNLAEREEAELYKWFKQLVRRSK